MIDLQFLCSNSRRPSGADSKLIACYPYVVCALVWIALIIFINPVGEFMINDDWSFARMLKILLTEGRISATGWGKGGPSAIVHILWGGLFTSFLGFSATTLRISVLVMGVACAFALLVLLRRCGAPRWAALLGTLTLVFNPLFLSQSFTYMTDITFVSLAIFSLLFIHLGTSDSKTTLTVIGLLLALASILTRQIGIVIPLGFIAAVIVHPKGEELGRTKMIALALAISLAPWPMYECFLSWVGSTTVVDHAVFGHILGYPITKGFPDYVVFILVQVFHGALGYTAFLISPVLALAYVPWFKRRDFRWFLYALTVGFAILEALLILGWVDLPILFHINVIFDCGIGPILLKDTYIEGIQRTCSMGAPLFYLVIYWAMLAVVALLAEMQSMVRDLFSGWPGKTETGAGFLTALCLFASIFYLGIIILTDFHDRYLIPLCAFLIICIVSARSSDYASSWTVKMSLPGIISLIVIALCSAAMVKDFMEMKRSQKQAQDYVVQRLGTDPCRFDGGFEFNGYHCYSKDFKAKEGLSWWWVGREDYLLTLGPLPGYKAVKVFPFERWVGPDGGVYILKPTLSERDLYVEKAKSPSSD